MKSQPPSSEAVADQIVSGVKQQSGELLSTTGLGLDPEDISLDQEADQLKPAITNQDAIWSWAEEKDLVADSTRQRIDDLASKGKSLTDEKELPKLFDQSNPFAAEETSATALEELSASPVPLLRGEVMQDSMLATLRDKIQNAPSLKEPIVKQIEQGKEYKELLIKERASLLDRSYGEVTLGLASRASELIQVVPVVGTYLTRHLSLGIGVDGLLNGFRDSKALVGLKTLAKVEVLPRRLYLQAENTSYFSDVSYLYEEVEEQRKNVQVPYIGAGVLLNVFDTKSINVSLMHRLGEHPFFDEGTASWVVRLGMSFFRQPKLQ